MQCIAGIHQIHWCYCYKACWRRARKLEASWISTDRGGVAACSQLLLAPPTHQEDVRWWQTGLQEQALAKDDHDQRQMRASGTASTQAPLANSGRQRQCRRKSTVHCRARSFRHAQELFTEPISRPRKKKKGSRGISITHDPVSVLT